MFKIPKEIKQKLLNAFDEMQKRFSKKRLDDLLKCGISVYHYLLLKEINETDFKKINDIDFVVLCGLFNFIFDIREHPDHYPYSFYDVEVFTMLDNASFELNHFIKYGMNK